MNIRLLRHLSVIPLLALFSGCASDDIEYTEAEKQYEAAKKRVEKGEYNMAAFELEKFSANFPYSTYAAKGELLRIFAAYKGSEFILSEMLSESFVERHPKHPHVDYALYMLAMSHYKQRGSESKDPTHNKLAIEAFKRLISEHPRSKYAKDGQARLQKLYDTIASHELIVGKYYFDRERYVAAANRFQTVIKEYQTTSAIEESLYYLAASYAEMGLFKDARQMALLLRHNYPNSEWSSRVKEYL
ncbi:Beta-barrel assembly machine subunit BamD [Mariprofundus ferrinatatus]|uniref:Outer membrane protein assembly factor BamD n=1 Tax=Mariprofundus ferrinatatus TaxID=1921087 RepID=A0A2K8L2P1_9PROT|nr:outer membrane protein assembly factor BamD [Mariprofundus ferrinatatus]ATX81595.1 Beta-barrel assembly machine subunit BamD [Mariprofundus ferrinatatus]